MKTVNEVINHIMEIWDKLDTIKATYQEKYGDKWWINWINDPNKKALEQEEATLIEEANNFKIKVKNPNKVFGCRVLEKYGAGVDFVDCNFLSDIALSAKKQVGIVQCPFLIETDGTATYMKDTNVKYNVQRDDKDVYVKYHYDSIYHLVCKMDKEDK